MSIFRGRSGRHRRDVTRNLAAATETVPQAVRSSPTIIVAHPGEVVSKTDGDVHRVTFTQLCQLYGVDPRTTLNAAHPAHASLARYRRELAPEEVIDLFPRYDGCYDGAALILGLPR